MNNKRDSPSKQIKCRACKQLFTPEKYKGTAKYCPDPKCQDEKRLRNQRQQRKRQLLKKLNPIKIKRTNKVCCCCRRKRVPKKKINGVYLTRLCEDCFRKGESDILIEHRVLCDK